MQVLGTLRLSLLLLLVSSLEASAATTRWKVKEGPTAKTRSARTKPLYKGQQASPVKAFPPGQEFEVSEEIFHKQTGITYLRLKDGPGWMYDMTLEKEVVCVKVASWLSVIPGISILLVVLVLAGYWYPRRSAPKPEPETEPELKSPSTGTEAGSQVFEGTESTCKHQDSLESAESSLKLEALKAGQKVIILQEGSEQTYRTGTKGLLGEITGNVNPHEVCPVEVKVFTEAREFKAWYKSEWLEFL